MQSRDTLRFIESTKQALFEEILCERIWHLYFKRFDAKKGISIRLLDSKAHNFVKMGLIKNEKEFEQRILYLTKINSSYSNNEWIRFHQLPFALNKNNNSNAKRANNELYRFDKKISGEAINSPSKILSQDLIEANIDRTGRIAWYFEANTKELMFFPGIFEPVKSLFVIIFTLFFF